MSQPILSICICTIPERKKLCDELVADFQGQRKNLNLTKDDVEIVTAEDTPDLKTGYRQMNIGEKSNELFTKSNGRNKVRFDDDDLPHPHYIERILAAIEKSNADIITFNIAHYLEGNFQKTFVVNTKEERDTSLKNGIYKINRIFFHLMPHKAELAAQCKFPSTNWQEDMAYTEQLKKLIKTEHHIDETLYSYFQIPKQH